MILPSKFDVFNGQKNLSAQELFYAQNLLLAKTFGSAPDCFKTIDIFKNCLWRKQSVALPTVLRPYIISKLLLAKTFGSAPDCFKTMHRFKNCF